MFIKHVSRACSSFVKNADLKFCSSLSRTRAANRVVLISTSNSIYENLALEEWMYEKTDFSDTDYLLMWKNRATVVCGRHQNPWLEANIPQACMDSVDIARRSSGGGTVYHDEGNINLSFLKARDRYNRKENLRLVVNAIKSQWDLELALNDRDDILLDHFYKVSGTAAKLGRTQSYHHFTLLVDVDTSQLWKLLDSPMEGVESKATKSIPATVQNLKEKAPDMTFELLAKVIGHRFIQEAGQKITQENFRFINPVNKTEFPGVEEFQNRLQSWDWIFGKTPKFSINRTFSGHEFLGMVCTLKIHVDIEKGSAISLSVHLDNQNLADLMAVVNKYYSENVRDLKLNNENLYHLKMRSHEHLETIFILKSEILPVAKWIIKCVDLCFRFI